ncbi:MAG: isoprenylcysteine carboxylmethyltransferase family protein [Ignavibacteria bacterium]
MKFVPASFKSAVFVFVQFACLIAIYYDIHLYPRNIFIGIGILFFLFIGIWAIFTMKFNINIAPDIPPNSNLIITGPYKHVRHPMYTSVLGITICFIIDDFSLFKTAVYVILLINFIMKLEYEEKMLHAKFPEYSDYVNTTKRLIPFIY